MVPTCLGREQGRWRHFLLMREEGRRFWQQAAVIQRWATGRWPESMVPPERGLRRLVGTVYVQSAGLSRSFGSSNPGHPRRSGGGCELKADKDYHFKVDNDENEHQLSLRTVSLGAGAKDELHIVEAEAMNYEGSPIKVTLATLKMSVQPTVSLGGFEITPPVVLRLRCGSGPVHISGQHLVAVEEDAESEDEDEEDVKLLSMSGKRSAPGGGNKVPQKKVKIDEDEEEEDEDDEDDEDDDDDDFDDEETEEKVPVKKSVRDTPAKNAQKSNQNGKDLKPSTPRSKGQESFKKQEKTPKTPKGPSSVEDIKAKMQASIEKGGSLPKVEAKFINYVKNCFRMTDQEAIQDLWQWRKSL